MLKAPSDRRRPSVFAVGMASRSQKKNACRRVQPAVVERNGQPALRVVRQDLAAVSHRQHYLQANTTFRPTLP